MTRQQGFLLACIAASAIVAFVVVLPFVEFVLGAAVLAYLLSPLHRRLTPRVGGRTSAVLLILSSVLVVVVPLAYVGIRLVRDMRSLARGNIDLQIAAIEASLAEQFGLDVALEPHLRSAGQDGIDLLTGSVGDVFATAMHTGMGFGLLFFLVYYALRDGPDLVEWTMEHSPLAEPVSEELYDQIEQTTWGVVIGHILVAVFQGLVGGVGLWVAGIPKVAFWTFVMIILGLLPLIGAFAVWGAASAYLLAIGATADGLLLAAYGLLVVSSVDNFVRPIVIDRRANLNPGLILLGVFGGVYVLGFVGLFVGPVVLGVFTATVRTYVEEYDRLIEKPAEQAGTTPAEQTVTGPSVDDADGEVNEPPAATSTPTEGSGDDADGLSDVSDSAG
ncbi:Predicted PurR-regulated permease PerM [Natronoarchaeum philippinense]|uniref:Predicted PurR-regulated permease PerM n=1 Tax=Natronoarchaeum philippinense TaxID=558529 RepID=A0A285N5K3_NATPI|nr:AI-2E family transporter [Natronoarchaeum philippinense]SNZ04709.1 Predicted PurR-regulated permease PerM [Natronoarchaeum philippinense]